MKLVSMVAAACDDKYLAKFLANNAVMTDHAPLLCMLSEQDTWNEEIVAHFDYEGSDVYFHRENAGLGRNGLHKYYEMMLPMFYAMDGDWLAYFCSDHHIVTPGWDSLVLAKLQGLDPNEPIVAVPGWFNTGSVSHIVSRGYLRALRDRIAGHGNLDSYINYAITGCHGLKVVPLPKMFWDFTANDVNPMTQIYVKTPLSVEGALMKDFFDESIQRQIIQDRNSLSDAVMRYQAK